MNSPGTRLLSILLYRTILVGAVLVALKLAYDGVYLLAGALVLALAMFAYLQFGEARLLE